MLGKFDGKKLKLSVSRLVCILFPKLEKLVPQLHMASVYALLSEFPSAHAVASAYLTRLTNLLSESSDRKSTRLNSSHWNKSRMPSSA